MGAHILIIEDNPANLELMRYLLQAFGHTIASAVDGKSGISAAGSESADLIICDVQLPDMSGMEVVAAIKSEPALKDTPVLAVTAFAMEGDRGRLLQAKFDGYIAKPIDPEKFPGEIDEFLPFAKRSLTLPPRGDSSAAVQGLPSNGRTILAVDNLQTHLEFASSLFEYMGYRVVTAASMTEALRVARESVPDIIVSDVGMPGGSGYDFIAQVKRDPRLASVPFVFITSTALDPAERDRGLALGAAKYLCRPIDPKRLLVEIEDVFGRA